MEIECPGSAAEIYHKLKAKLNDYKSQGKLEQIKNIDYDDDHLKALCKGTGFTGVFECIDQKVKIDIDLNFLLKPMRGQIEEVIRKIVNKIFHPPAA